MPSTRYLVSLCALLIAACGDDNAVCTQSIEPVLYFLVVDSVSHDEICDATVTITRDTFSTETRSRCGGTMQSVFSDPPERPGTYELTASHPGYAAKTVSAVVKDAPCHTAQAHVTIELEPVGE